MKNIIVIVAFALVTSLTNISCRDKPKVFTAIIEVKDIEFYDGNTLYKAYVRESIGKPLRNLFLHSYQYHDLKVGDIVECKNVDSPFVSEDRNVLVSIVKNSTMQFSLSIK